MRLRISGGKIAPSVRMVVKAVPALIARLRRVGWGEIRTGPECRGVTAAPRAATPRGVWKLRARECARRATRDRALGRYFQSLASERAFRSGCVARIPLVVRRR